MKNNLDNDKKDLQSVTDLFTKDLEKDLSLDVSDKTENAILDGLGEGVDKANAKGYRGSKLSGATKDLLKDIDAIRDEQLARNEERFIKQEIQEKEYLQNIEDINVKAIDSKLSKLKGSNAEERKEIAQLSLEKQKLIKETNSKIFDIEVKDLDNRLEAQRQKEQENLDMVLEDERFSDVMKSEARNTFYSNMLKLQEGYQQDYKLLEATHNQNRVEDELKISNEIIKTKKDKSKEEIKLEKERFEGLLKTMGDISEASKQKIEIASSQARVDILNDKSLSERRRQTELEKINHNERLGLLQEESSLLTRTITTYKEKANITEEEKKKLDALLLSLQKTKEDVVNEENFKPSKGGGWEAPSTSGSLDTITEGISNTFGADEDQSKMIGEALSQSYDLAMQAMQGYYDLELDRIQRNKEAILESLNIREQDRLDLAQSVGEREAIQREFNQKRENEEIKAQEQSLKVKKSELKMAYIMELANIGMSVAKYGLGGIAIGAVLTALATARYMTSMATLSTTKFEKGGIINGKSHSQGGEKAIVGGNNIELEGSEAVINKKSMSSASKYTISGTPKQIASKINQIGGGVSFANGARVMSSSSSMVSRGVQAPMFEGYYSNERNERNLQMVLSGVNELSKAVNRVDSKKVFLTNKEVYNGQKDYGTSNKAKSI